MHRGRRFGDGMQFGFSPHLLCFRPNDVVPEELLEAHPLNGVPLEQTSNQLLQSSTDWKSLDSSLRRRRRPTRLLVRKPDPILSSFDLLEEFDVILSLEGRTTDRHLVEDGSNGPEIGLRVVLLVTEDLGSHVEPRKNRRATRTDVSLPLRMM